MNLEEENSLAQLLCSWKVREDIIKSFIDNGITIELLPKLSEENLKELCPHMATRICIKERVAELVTATTPTESNTLSTTSTLVDNKVDGASFITLDEISLNDLLEEQNSARSPRNFPYFDLATLLQTTAGGSSIIEYYKNFGCLNNTKRNQLTDIIIKHVYTHIVNSKITYEEYNILAAKIITLFPKEAVGTYYTKPIQKNQTVNKRSVVAKGKLVDKVRNLIYKYGDRRRSSTTNHDHEIPQKKICPSNLKESHKSALIWLQNHSDPWEEVEIKWKETYELRRAAEYENLHNFLREWSILNHSRSYVLINIDFDLMFPEKGLNFYLNWDDFYNKIIQLRPTQDENIVNLINSVKNLEDDLKIPSQICVLGHLIPPKGRLNKKEKFSTQEAIESIFVCAKLHPEAEAKHRVHYLEYAESNFSNTTAGDIDNLIATQKEKASLRKLSVQPYLIFQGELHEASSPLLVIDNAKYYFESTRKAFDTLFKAYHVFHARYPKSSDHLYLIIQRCVYNVKTNYDNIVPYIADILELK